MVQSNAFYSFYIVVHMNTLSISCIFVSRKSIVSRQSLTADTARLLLDEMITFVLHESCHALEYLHVINRGNKSHNIVR
jgi:hypothetical protein